MKQATPSTADERDARAAAIVLEVLLAATKPGAIVERCEGDDESPEWLVVTSRAGKLTSCFHFDFLDHSQRIAKSKEARNGLRSIRTCPRRNPETTLSIGPTLRCT